MAIKDSRPPRWKAYFIGIGGIGVSALARYFLSQKWAVSGSDAADGTVCQSLIKDGVRVKFGHKKANIPVSGVQLVVRSQAVDPKNPEVREALRHGMRVLTYPEALGEVTRQHTTIAVAGAHGKSTTTALAALVLMKAGFDPTVIVGTNLKEFGGRNFRAGKGKYLVVEADEYGRAFHHYSPAFAIVTNIDREHLDIYKDLADVKRSFLKFLGNVREGGTLILNRDDAHLFSLHRRIAALAKKNKLKVVWYSLRDRSAGKIRSAAKIFGEHNVSNAEAAYQLGRVLKVSEKKIFAAIGSYRGAWRRMEYRGTMKIKGVREPVPVYDDYAHHPSEIKASLAALAARFPGRPLICVFQPHQGKRLEALFKEFSGAFTDADAVILLPLYKVRGRDEQFAKTSRDLASALRAHPAFRRKRVIYLDDPKKLAEAIGAGVPAPCSPLVVMMGAGDIVNYTEKLLDG